MKKKLIFSLLVLAGVPSLSMAVDEARLLRFPATNGNEIVRNVSSFFTGRQNDCIHRAIRW